MTDARAAVPLPKWPFYLADIALSAIIVYIIWRLGPIEGTADIVIATGCLFAASWAAWISITPWLNEHRAGTEIQESANLKSSLEQIQSVEKVADLIRQANSQWQLVQDAAGRTVTAAQEISEKMKTETDEFMRFLDNANNSERAGLRLEVEKLRRMEGDWVKVCVQMLDHVFALTSAAERSGQTNVITQLQHFQNVCRDVTRRIGLNPFAPAISEPFDARAHQLTDTAINPPPGARVGGILAVGFTYQGQLIRRALVMLEGDGSENPATENAPSAEENAPVSEPEAQNPGEESAELEPEGQARDSSPARGAVPSEQDELPLV